MKVVELAKNLKLKPADVMELAKMSDINVTLITDELEDDQVDTIENLFKTLQHSNTKFFGLRKNILTKKFEIITIELRDIDLNKLNYNVVGEYKNIYYASEPFFSEITNSGVFSEKTYNKGK